MSRRKRASMREGPLADLFRSTSDDAPVDPPEMEAQPHAEEPVVEESAPASEEPRYGRQDPVERESEDAEAPPVESSSAETAPERLKRVFSEEPRIQRRELEPIVETPRY